MSTNPADIWKAATLIMIKQSDRFGPELEAMRAAVGVTIEDDTLVVGLPVGSHHLAGHLEVPANRNRIRNALEAASGKRWELKVILGTTEEDVARAKRMQEKVIESGAVAAERRRVEARMEDAWERLMTQMMVHYQRLQLRQLPHVKARFLRDGLRWLSDIQDEMEHAPKHLWEVNERAFGRAIERLASLSDLPPTLVALELQRLRAQEGKSETPARPDQHTEGGDDDAD
jgi:hypothetical protein